MTFTASFLHRLHAALLAAFTRDELRQLAALCLDADFDHIVPEMGFSDQAFEFVRWAKRQGRVEDLVVCAQGARPMDDELAALRREMQGPQMVWGADSVITEQRIDVKKLVDRLAGRLDDEGAAQGLTDDEMRLIRRYADADAAQGAGAQDGSQGVFQHYLDLFAAEEDANAAGSERRDT